MTKLMTVRKKSGYSRAEIAQLADIPVKTLEAYEQGRRSVMGMKIDRVWRLCQILHCEPDEIIEDEDLNNM